MSDLFLKNEVNVHEACELFRFPPSDLTCFNVMKRLYAMDSRGIPCLENELSQLFYSHDLGVHKIHNREQIEKYIKRLVNAKYIFYESSTNTYHTSIGFRDWIEDIMDDGKDVRSGILNSSLYQIKILFQDYADMNGDPDGQKKCLNKVFNYVSRLRHDFRHNLTVINRQQRDLIHEEKIFSVRERHLQVLDADFAEVKSVRNELYQMLNESPVFLNNTNDDIANLHGVISLLIVDVDNISSEVQYSLSQNILIYQKQHQLFDKTEKILSLYDKGELELMSNVEEFVSGDYHPIQCIKVRSSLKKIYMEETDFSDVERENIVIRFFDNLCRSLDTDMRFMKDSNESLPVFQPVSPDPDIVASDVVIQALDLFKSSDATDLFSFCISCPLFDEFPDYVRTYPLIECLYHMEELNVQFASERKIWKGMSYLNFVKIN